jgi:hypothetical protein
MAGAGQCGCTVSARPRRLVPTRALMCPSEALRVRQGGVPQHPPLAPYPTPFARAPSAPNPHFPAPRPSRQHGAPQPRAPGDLRGAEPDAAAAGHGGGPGDDAEALVQQQGQQPARALHRRRGRVPRPG